MGRGKHVIWIIAAVLVLAGVSFFLFQWTGGSENEQPATQNDPTSENGQPVTQNDPTIEQPNTTDSPNDSEQNAARLAEIDAVLTDPYLVLVNSDNGLGADDVPESTTTLQGMTLESVTAEHLQQMLDDMDQAGLDTITIYSAYRNYSRQEQNFNNKIAQYIDKGYDRERAEEIAATIVNPPGKSEHQTGLAADICTDEIVSRYGELSEAFEDTPEYRWLYEHCDEYGFILRYPKDKEDVTGITFEPWHYRYVGESCAKEIMEQKICLEEYIANLKAEKESLE